MQNVSEKHRFVVLSRNRPQMLLGLLRSLINASTPVSHILVSDNSTNPNLRDHVRALCNDLNIRFIHHCNLTIYEHYHFVLTSSDTPYVSILHDDDLAYGTINAIVNSAISSYPNASAIAFNGCLVSSHGITQSPAQLAWKTNKKVLEISSSEQLLFHWISPLAHGIAPFSTYVFNTKLYDQSWFSTYKNARLFYDTILVAFFASRGSVIWINKPVMAVLQHDSSLTSETTIHDDIAFVRTYLKTFVPRAKIRYILDVFLLYRFRKRRVFQSAFIQCSLNFLYYSSIILYFLSHPLRLPLFCKNNLFSL